MQSHKLIKDVELWEQSAYATLKTIKKLKTKDQEI